MKLCLEVLVRLHLKVLDQSLEIYSRQLAKACLGELLIDSRQPAQVHIIAVIATYERTSSRSLANQAMSQIGLVHMRIILFIERGTQVLLGRRINVRPFRPSYRIIHVIIVGNAVLVGLQRKIGRIQGVGLHGHLHTLLPVHAPRILDEKEVLLVERLRIRDFHGRDEVSAIKLRRF